MVKGELAVTHGVELLRGERSQDEAITDVDAELVAAAVPARVLRQPPAKPLDRLRRFRFVGWLDVPDLCAPDAHVHQGAAFPDRIHAGDVPRHRCRSEVSEGPKLAILKLGDVHGLS